MDFSRLWGFVPWLIVLFLMGTLAVMAVLFINLQNSATVDDITPVVEIIGEEGEEIATRTLVPIQPVNIEVSTAIPTQELVRLVTPIQFQPDNVLPSDRVWFRARHQHRPPLATPDPSGTPTETPSPSLKRQPLQQHQMPVVTLSARLPIMTKPLSLTTPENSETPTLSATPSN